MENIDYYDKIKRNRNREDQYWFREIGKKSDRDREYDRRSDRGRMRERERESDRGSDRERGRERKSDRGSDREREREREREKEREQEDDNLKKKAYKQNGVSRQLNDDEDNYYNRMKDKKDKSEYSGDVRRGDSEFGGNKSFLKLDKMDIQIPKNEDGNDTGYIKCKVEGYLVLNIKSEDFLQMLNKN